MDCPTKSGNDERRTKKKGSGTPTDVFMNLRALRARRACTADTCTQICVHKICYTRSPIGVPLRLLPSGLSALGRNSRPGFLGRGRTFDPVRSLQPGSKDLALLHGRYPRPPVPVQGNAPPGPVIVPVSMMPEAARERIVSFRPRAPHSLHLQEYPRPKASFTERDSFPITEMGTSKVKI